MRNPRKATGKFRGVWWGWGGGGGGELEFSEAKLKLHQQEKYAYCLKGHNRNSYDLHVTSSMHLWKIVLFFLNFCVQDSTLAVICAQIGSTDLVSRSRQKPRKIWTSGPVPSVSRPAAEWRRKSCTVCAVSLTMKGSM